MDFVLLAADPQPLSPRFFSERIEEISAEVSQQLYNALKGGGFLDDHSYLIEDPRYAIPSSLCQCRKPHVYQVDSGSSPQTGFSVHNTDVAVSRIDMKA